MVAVESGGVLGGIDFNVKRQESHRIRGRIFDNDPNGSPASNKTLRLYFLGGGFSTGDEMGRIWSFTRSSADGLFEFRNIVPGFFAITCINCGESSDSGYVQVQVGDSDVENIDGKHHKRTYPLVGRRPNFRRTPAIHELPRCAGAAKRRGNVRR